MSKVYATQDATRISSVDLPGIKGVRVGHEVVEGNADCGGLVLQQVARHGAWIMRIYTQCTGHLQADYIAVVP